MIQAGERARLAARVFVDTHKQLEGIHSDDDDDDDYSCHSDRTRIRRSAARGAHSPARDDLCVYRNEGLAFICLCV